MNQLTDAATRSNRRVPSPEFYLQLFNHFKPRITAAHKRIMAMDDRRTTARLIRLYSFLIALQESRRSLMGYYQPLDTPRMKFVRNRRTPVGRRI